MGQVAQTARRLTMTGRLGFEPGSQWGENFSSLLRVQTIHRVQSASYKMSIGACGVKMAKRKASQLLSSAVAVNMRILSFTFAIIPENSFYDFLQMIVAHGDSGYVRAFLLGSLNVLLDNIKVMNDGNNDYNIRCNSILFLKF